MNYNTRFYRDFSSTARWKTYGVKIDTTDIFIRSSFMMKELAEKTVGYLRSTITQHIDDYEDFLYSYKPVRRVDTGISIIEAMYDASEKAGVGPMAAVAGGRADWGVAIETVARQSDLGFLPIDHEQYDFVIPESRRDRPAVQAFCQLLEDPAIRLRLDEMGFESVDE